MEITYDTDHALTAQTKDEILSCKLHEEYNGSTDTRLFVAGNGTNRCYYTGEMQDGTASALYFPENEIAVCPAHTAGHYSKVFKDGHTIS